MIFIPPPVLRLRRTRRGRHWALERDGAGDIFSSRELCGVLMGRLDFPATLTRAGCFFPGVPDIPAAPSENSWQVPGDGYRWLWRFPGRPGFDEPGFFSHTAISGCLADQSRKTQPTLTAPTMSPSGWRARVSPWRSQAQVGKISLGARMFWACFSMPNDRFPDVAILANEA